MSLWASCLWRPPATAILVGEFNRDRTSEVNSLEVISVEQMFVQN